MPKISFVIPYFRKQKTIEKCLKTLFNQSVKDIEVILVKDGPDKEVDDSLIRFRKYPNFQIAEIPHGGACAARNFGASLAKGEYISFWDADCYIESGAAAVWLQIFQKYPEVDFVYSGYQFTEGMGGIPSESFDPYMLRVNNYIASMFPIKREKAPNWDNNLKSLQDWDFWLTAVEDGCKGFFSRGYAFKTDYPTPDSISGQGCTAENWLDRLETVKKKHGIPIRTICVSAFEDREEGIRIAKMLDADYRDFPTEKPHRYRTIIQVGWNPEKADLHAEVFKDPNKEIRKVLFWRGQDLQSILHKTPVAAAQALVEVINRSVHFQFCEDKFTKQALQRIGFKVVVFPLPMDTEGYEIKLLPEKFKVMVDMASEFEEFMEGVHRALPDVSFSTLKGVLNVDDYSLFVQFLHEKSINQYVKKFLLNGRRVISNIQAPYCGFVSDMQALELMRKQIVREIRKAQERKNVYQEAIDFYKDHCSPERFKRAFRVVLGLEEKKVEEAKPEEVPA